jgi:hypothetical protein
MPMMEDIELTVAHAAPVLVRCRRGALPTRAVATMSTPARIRHVDPAALADRCRPRGRYGYHTVVDGLAVFEGRLWIRVGDFSPMGTRPGPAPGAPTRLSEVVRTLAGEDVAHIRAELDGLGLRPWHLNNLYGVLGDHPKVLDGREVDVPSLELDLRAETSAAVRARIERDLVHDGDRAWTVLAPPLVHMDREAWVLPVRTIGTVDFKPGCLPDEIGDYLDFLGHMSPKGGLTQRVSNGVLQTARDLSDDLPDLDPTPLSDVLRNLRRHALLAYEIARRTAMVYRDADREFILPHLQALLPVVARASADLLGPDEAADAMDRVSACASAIMNVKAGPGSQNSQGVHLMHMVTTYQDMVARPRLARVAVPEADADSLSALAR